MPGCHGYPIKLKDLPVGATFTVGGYPGLVEGRLNGCVRVRIDDRTGTRPGIKTTYSRHVWSSEINVRIPDPPQKGPEAEYWWIERQEASLNLWVSSEGAYFVNEAGDDPPQPNLYGWGE